MNLEHFENKLNKKFEEFHPTVNDEMIWDKIEGRLPGEKKRHRFLWLILGALLGLIVLATIAFQKVNDQHEGIDKDTFQSAQKSASELLVGSAESEKVNESDEVVSEDDQMQTIVQATSDPQLSVLESQISKIEKRLNAMEKALTIDTKVPSDTEVVFDQKLYQESILSAEKTSVDEVSLINPIQYLGMVPFKMMDVLTRNTPVVTFESLAINSDETNRVGALHLGLTYYQSSINHESDEVNSELLSLRSDAESSYEALQLGIMYEYPLSKHFSLSGGIRYMLNNWESKHVLCEEQTLEEQGLRFNQVTKTTISRIGTDHIFSLPLLINFTNDLGSKLKVDFAIGYEHSISAKHQGFEIDPEGVEYDIQLDTEGRYKNIMGSYVLGRLGLRYAFADKTDFRFGLESKMGLTNFQSDFVSVSKKYNYYGLNVGVIRQF
jgi:hypothetical protein